MIRKTWWVVQAVLSLIVAFLTANYFFDGGQGFPYFRALTVPTYAYDVLAVMVFAVPIFWAILHLVGGVFFGLAAGGLLDGIRLGLILGVGMALARCWPFCFAVGLGTWAGQGPLMYVIGAVVVGILLFTLDRALGFFWTSTIRGKTED